MHITDFPTDGQGVLGQEALDFFEEKGYLAFPGLLPEEFNQSMKEATAAFDEARGENRGSILPIEWEGLAPLATWEPMMKILDQVVGESYSMHHYHAAIHKAGNDGVRWHQDYEQWPQTNRSHTMVHVFYYLDGLNGTIGDLMFVPGSHKTIAARNAMGIFGYQELPGTKVVDDVPPGTAIIVHSALWHARRPKPGGGDRPRYFLDISYCEGGVKWPNSTGWIERPEEVAEKGWYSEGREKVLDRSMFFDNNELRVKCNNLSGSVVLEMGA